MIRRGIIILLFTLILAYSASAMTVTLNSPEDDEIINNTGGSIDFKCKVSYTPGEDNLTALSLYTSGSWAPTGIQNTTSVDPDTLVTFQVSVGDKPNQTYEWNCLAESLEGPPTWASDNFTFNLAEEPVTVTNNPPTCEVANTNITVDEDSGTWTLDANMTKTPDLVNISCLDPEGKALTYTLGTPICSGGTCSGTFSLSNNDILTFTTEANANGTVTIPINVNDGNNTIQISAQVIVTPVNDPPYLSSNIPNKTWDQDTTAKIDLGEYFFDVDDSTLNYSYTFVTSSPNIAVVIEDDGDAVFTPPTGWTGTETLTFTASDASNSIVTSNEVSLIVKTNTTTTNSQPQILTTEPSTDPTIILGQSQTFNITKSDADNDTLNVAWYVDEIVQADYTSDTFKYTPTSVGSFAIKVKVSDGKASPVVETWALTVQSAQNQTTNQTASSGQAKSGQNISKSICGDGTCAEDEDYSTGTNPCCKDCGCGDDPAYKCAEDTGKCLKEVKSKNMIILIVVLGVFVVGAGVGLYLYKKKQEKSIFGLTDVHFEVPPKDAQAGAVKKEDPKKAEEKRPAQEPVKKKEEKPVDTAQKVKPADPQLKSYILYHLKKGKPFEDIKKELKQVGWKESQIEEAYTAAKLEETFS